MRRYGSGGATTAGVRGQGFSLVSPRLFRGFPEGGAPFRAEGLFETGEGTHCRDARVRARPGDGENDTPPRCVQEGTEMGDNRGRGGGGSMMAVRGVPGSQVFEESPREACRQGHFEDGSGCQPCSSRGRHAPEPVRGGRAQDACEWKAQALCTQPQAGRRQGGRTGRRQGRPREEGLGMGPIVNRPAQDEEGSGWTWPGDRTEEGGVSRRARRQEQASCRSGRQAGRISGPVGPCPGWRGPSPGVPGVARGEAGRDRYGWVA